MRDRAYALIHGQAEKELTRLPSKSVDLVITSPPYDDVRDYDGYSFTFSTFQLIVRELYRILKDGGTVIWVVADQTIGGSETGTSFRQALYFKHFGFRIHDTMIYHRYGPPKTHRRYEQAFEYMFAFTKGPPKTFNGLREPKKFPEKKKRTKAWTRWADGTFKYSENNLDPTRLKYNVFYYPLGTQDKLATEHPAVFPEGLVRDQMLTWSNEGDVVLDPMCGSGTVGKVAKQLGRSFVGIDTSERYIDIAKQRIRASLCVLP